jgi:ABC-type nitrate/sulfonate/bicarbonate transport system permease component
MSELFELRGSLKKRQSLLLGIIGLVIFLLSWWALAELLSQQRPVLEDFDPRLPSSLNADSLDNQINLDSLATVDSLRFANAKEFIKVYPLLPPPHLVVRSFPDLVQKDELAYNTGRSVWLNVQGYFWAIIISLPIGFLIGLFPLFRGLFSKQVDALRYLPLTALTGLFIIWFGIEDRMKIAFLAFGIIVYLLPVVVQRIDEVKDVYLKTVFTLGASQWQTIKNVYFPSVFSKLMDDIRVLTAISWTYIIIAELLNRQGGIGSLIYIKARQGQIPKVFGILIVIILIGFIQDRIFVYLDKRLFPHKYYKRTLVGIKEIEFGIFTILGMITLALFIGFLPSSVASIVSLLAWIVPLAGLLMIGYGEFNLYKAFKKSQ